MAMSKRDKAALAAVIVLAPGGFLIGGALARRYWQQRKAVRAKRQAGGQAGGQAAKPGADD